MRNAIHDNVELPPLPRGYRWQAGCVQRHGDGGERGRILSRPAFGTRILRAEDTHAQVLELAVMQIEGVWTREFIPMDQLRRNNSERGMLSAGLVPSMGRFAPLRTYLMDYAEMLHEQKRVYPAYSSLGWKDRNLLLGNTLYHIHGDKPAALMPEAAHFADATVPRGKLEHWVAAAQVFVEPEQAAQLRVMLFAAANLLLELCNELPYVLAVVGPAASGKTTALRAAATIFGRPDRLMGNTSDEVRLVDTAAAALGDVPCFLDDAYAGNPQWLYADLLKVMMGRSFKVREGWRSVPIVCSKEPIASRDAFVAETRMMRADLHRVLTLFMPEVSGRAAAVSTALSDMVANSGTVGERLARYLTRHHQAVLPRINKAASDMAAEADVPMPQYKRAVLCASAYVAAEVLVSAVNLQIDLPSVREGLLQVLRTQPQ